MKARAIILSVTIYTDTHQLHNFMSSREQLFEGLSNRGSLKIEVSCGPLAANQIRCQLSISLFYPWHLTNEHRQNSLLSHRQSLHGFGFD